MRAPEPVLLGAIASSLHLSSALYLAFAPLLMIRARTLRYVAGAAFLLYVSGLSQKLLAALIPSLHTAVMTYAMDPDYQIGVRFDSNIDPALPWRFEPVERTIRIAPGARTQVSYRATNLTARTTTGTAAFNVTPINASIVSRAGTSEMPTSVAVRP